MRRSWISDRNDLFDQLFALILPTKFRVNLPFGSGEETQIRLSRWPPRPPSWISDRF